MYMICHDHKYSYVRCIVVYIRGSLTSNILVANLENTVMIEAYRQSGLQNEHAVTKYFKEISSQCTSAR